MTSQTQNKHIYYTLNIHAQGGIRTRSHGLRAIETVHASDRSATVTDGHIYIAILMFLYKLSGLIKLFSYKYSVFWQFV
jgi:hypothetical protein